MEKWKIFSPEKSDAVPPESVDKVVFFTLICETLLTARKLGFKCCTAKGRLDIAI